MEVNAEMSFNHFFIINSDALLNPSNLQKVFIDLTLLISLPMVSKSYCPAILILFSILIVL